MDNAEEAIRKNTGKTWNQYAASETYANLKRAYAVDSVTKAVDVDEILAGIYDFRK